MRKYLRRKIVPLAELLDIFKELQFENCLDVGAGTGLFLEFFYENKVIRKGIGTEINCNYFRKINDDLYIAGIDEIKKEKFDLIIFNDVLHHVTNKKDFIEKYIDSYLKNGGCIFVKEMNDRNLLCKYFN